MLLVVDQSGAVLAASSAQGPKLTSLQLGPLNDEIVTATEQDQALRLHRRYFPFWRWNLVSLISEESYLAPSHLATCTVYLRVFGVLASVLLTLLVIFRRLVLRPMRRIIKATRDISQGRFLTVPWTRPDELGQVAGAFNAIVASLEESRCAVDSALARLRESEEQYRMLAEHAMAFVTIVQGGASSCQPHDAGQDRPSEGGDNWPHGLGTGPPQGLGLAGGRGRPSREQLSRRRPLRVPLPHRRRAGTLVGGAGHAHPA